ncbi:MAG TPA: GNAT family N-acetyltransferase [Vicinamibacterales bacterium]
MPFRLRDATAADVSAIARLHVETFTETHRGGHAGGPAYELRESQWREFFERRDGFSFCVLVEEARGGLVGFAKGVRHDGGVAGYAGELNKIYLLGRVQRRGLGRVLLGAVAARFMERGVTSMLLFGDAASPSNGFYEAFGGERLLSEQGEFHGGYGWPDLRRLVAFERVWRFRAADGSDDAFEQVYGSAGPWAHLFAQSPGYRGTELQRAAKPGEYLLVDRWASRQAWEAFRRDFAAAYDALDRECEALTASEELVREGPAPGSAGD